MKMIIIGHRVAGVKIWIDSEFIAGVQTSNDES